MMTNEKPKYYRSMTEEEIEFVELWNSISATTSINKMTPDDLTILNYVLHMKVKRRRYIPISFRVAVADEDAWLDEYISQERYRAVTGEMPETRQCLEFPPVGDFICIEYLHREKALKQYQKDKEYYLATGEIPDGVYVPERALE